MQITIKIRYALLAIIALGIFVFTTLLPALAGLYFIKGERVLIYIDKDTNKHIYDWFAAKPHYTKAIQTSSFMRGDIVFRIASNLIDITSSDPSLIADPKFYAELVGARDMLIEENKKHPRELRMRTTLAQLYSILGDKENAIKEIEQALILSPNRQVLYWIAARYFSQAGRSSNAMKTLEQVIEFSGDAESYWQMTMFLMSVGRNEDALKYAKEAARLEYKFRTEQEAELYKSLREEYE